MGYAIMRANKLKVQSSISDRYNHDMRIFKVNNADPLRSSQNEMLVDQLMGRSYHDIYEDTVRGMQMKGAMGTVRADAVKGIDVFLGFSHEESENINIDAWAKKNVEWLREQFNPPDRQIHYTNKKGEEVTEEIDNVKSVVLHMDEATPHIHAFIVPIDENGRLNAKAYTAGHSQFVELQSSYAKEMKEFGLQRGEAHASATHEKTSEYYRRLIKAVDATLPSPEKGETLSHYHKRAESAFRDLNVKHNDELLKQRQELKKERSGLYLDRQEINRERQVLLKDKEDFKEETKAVNNEIKKLSQVYGETELTPEVLRKARRNHVRMERFEKALEDYPDRQKAQEVQQSYNDLVNWQYKREKAEKRDKANGREEKAVADER